MKKMALLLACIAVFIMLGTPCFAAGNETVYDINELQCVCYDANGNCVPQTRTAISTNTIPAYGMMIYYTTSGSRFNVAAGKTITVSLNLNRTATTQIGYNTSASGNVLFSSIYSSSPSRSFTVSQNGYYSILVKNCTGSPLTVSNGSITIY